MCQVSGPHPQGCPRCARLGIALCQGHPLSQPRLPRSQHWPAASSHPTASKHNGRCPAAMNRTSQTHPSGFSRAINPDESLNLWASLRFFNCKWKLLLLLGAGHPAALCTQLGSLKLPSSRLSESLSSYFKRKTSVTGNF